ncbi:MAG: ISNCY family transposase [Nitrososphaera sp.]
MRKAMEAQLRLDIPAFDKIEFDLSNRHELEAILMALKHVYESQEVLGSILQIIAQDVGCDTDTEIGCPGLSYWEVLVLAAVRLGCDLNYDALADLASNHRKLRRILGVGDWEDNRKFSRSTIQNNMVKLKPETICQISNTVVALGHRAIPDAITKVRGDSFVVQTNIHYPTDASLILDGARKVLSLSARLGQLLGVKTWHHWRTTFRTVKKLHRTIQKIGASHKLQKDKKAEKLKPVYHELMTKVVEIGLKALEFQENIAANKPQKKSTQRQVEKLRTELGYYLGATAEVLSLAHRRVFEGEAIPNTEKIFSLFEPHTELINRGKSPYPIEFGHRVFVYEDQAGFIVDHEVMDKGLTDDKVAVTRFRALQQRLANRIHVVSLDKGCWSPDNLKELEEIVDVVCLPKKGIRDIDAKLREESIAFRQARMWHPGVESAIHALVVGNGLSVCRDRGAEGYRRYVALGVLGRNLHTLGRILLTNSRQEQQPLLRRAA